MNIVGNIARAQIEQTKNLIETAGRELQLQRPSDLIDDGAGGKVRVNEPTTKLPVRRYYFGGLLTGGRGSTTAPENWFTTSMGEKYKLFFVLIDMPDADIEIGDFFYIRDDKYVVLFRHGDVDDYQSKFTVGLER